MRIKAEYAQTCGSQSHAAPGAYIHWACVGNLEFTTSWADFDSGVVTVSAQMAQGDAGKFRTIAFNLSDKTNNTAQNMYFDDIQLLVYRTPIPTQPVASTTFGDLVEVTPVIYSKSNNGNPAVAEPDGDGVYVVNNSLTSGDAWGTQFWIAAPYALPAGQKFYIEFDYKADVAGSAETQTHAADPGSYIIWHCIGNVSFEAPTEAVPADEEAGTPAIPASDGWKQFKKEQAIESDMAGWQSIAFNLNLHVENNYYFRNIKLMVPTKAEAVGYTLGAAGWATFSCDKNVRLDGATGYAAKWNGSFVELTEVTNVPANAGVIIKGVPTEITEYSFPIIESADPIEGNELKVAGLGTTGDGATIYALSKGSKGVGFYLVANGVEIPVGKAYLEIAAKGREFIPFNGDATSINAVATTKKVDNVLYNLAGQRVVKAQKGLYIVNGKKVLVK